MDTERLLEMGAKGIHLLFDVETINAAFGQDAECLRRAIADRDDEVHAAIRRLLSLPTLEEGRRFVAELAPDVRHIVVLLYFDLLDGRLRKAPILH